MITHIVILWLKKEEADQQKAVIEGALALRKIPGVENLRAGPMIPGSREIVESTFSVGLSMDFQDQATADIYQDHPIHQEFVEKFVKPLTSKVVVYDFGKG